MRSDASRFALAAVAALVAFLALSGTALADLKKPKDKEALRLYKEANAHYNMGNAHYNKSQFADAVGEYDRAVAGDRSNWRAWFNRGNALRSLGRNPEAIESYREVLKRNKDMAAARRQIQDLGGQP